MPAQLQRINARSVRHLAPGKQLLLLTAIACMLALGVCAGRLPDDTSPKLPFFVGEKLNFDVTISGGRRIGQSTMWIEGPTELRGTSTYLLRFDSRVRLALFTGISNSESWFDPIGKRSLRFIKHERNILNREDVSVDVYPAEKRWQAEDGTSGNSPSASSLDELSFIFFIRTLPLTPGTNYQFDRHFDAARNPVVISIVRREVTATPLGELHTVLVEMHVRDPKHYEGEGIIRINLTDDLCRLPARIESTMPVVGKAIMSLKAENASPDCAKR
ncbi:MAG TPA: DUF3108 domain-containing protein [Gemmatimonadaceae bacterium]|nr:DUF3108 domain-containing protein [Gemmatimonadaceae bacterium]